MNPKVTLALISNHQNEKLKPQKYGISHVLG
jgi:hypothetical protein